jgi:hypothetical protein
MLLRRDLSLFLGTSSGWEKAFSRVFSTIRRIHGGRLRKAFAHASGIGFNGLNIPTEGLFKWTI